MEELHDQQVTEKESCSGSAGKDKRIHLEENDKL